MARVASFEFFLELSHLGLVAVRTGLGPRHRKLLVVGAVARGTVDFGPGVLAGLPVIDDCRGHARVARDTFLPIVDPVDRIVRCEEVRDKPLEDRESLPLARIFSCPPLEILGIGCSRLTPDRAGPR